MCCWYLLILGSLTLIFPAHARVQVWPVTHPNDLFITKSAFWQLHHSWILLNWIHPFICFWLLYNVYISYILVWSFIKHTLRLNPPRERELLFPFFSLSGGVELFLSHQMNRNLGTVQCSFHPKRWGWASRNVCVWGGRERWHFLAQKDSSPSPDRATGRWNCMSGCNPCQSWHHHPMRATVLAWTRSAEIFIDAAYDSKSEQVQIPPIFSLQIPAALIVQRSLSPLAEDILSVFQFHSI